MTLSSRVLKISLFHGDGTRTDSEIPIYLSKKEALGEIEYCKKTYSQCIIDGTLDESAEAIFKIVETYTETWNH
jgi:hypothetical protein